VQSPFKSGITSDPPTFGDNGTIHYLVCDGGLADAIVAAISETNPVLTEVAKRQGIAVARVFQIIISQAGAPTVRARQPGIPLRSPGLFGAQGVTLVAGAQIT